MVLGPITAVKTCYYIGFSNVKLFIISMIFDRFVQSLSP